MFQAGQEPVDEKGRRRSLVFTLILLIRLVLSKLIFAVRGGRLDMGANGLGRVLARLFL